MGVFGAYLVFLLGHGAYHAWEYGFESPFMFCSYLYLFSSFSN